MKVTTATLTDEQKAFVALAEAFKAEEQRQVKLTLVGFVGIVLLGGTTWLMWGRR